MEISLKIPLQPYLYKYLVKELGQPYTLTKRDPLSRVLLSHLHRPSRIRPLEKKENEVFFVVEIPNVYWDRLGLNSLNSENAHQFIDHVKDMFYKELCVWVSSRMELKYSDKDRITPSAVKKSDALKSYCELFDINVDDVNMDTVIKNLQRRLKRWRQADRKGAA